MQPPTFLALQEAAIRAENIVKEKNEMEAKRKKTTGAFTSSYSRGSTFTPRGGFRSQRGSSRGKGNFQPRVPNRKSSGRGRGSGSVGSQSAPRSSGRGYVMVHVEEPIRLSVGDPNPNCAINVGN